MSEKFLNVKIEHLDFSVRTKHCLRAAGIDTVKELVSKTEEEISKLYYMGRKTLNEIKNVLCDECEGMTLGMLSPNKPTLYYNDIRGKISQEKWAEYSDLYRDYIYAYGCNSPSSPNKERNEFIWKERIKNKMPYAKIGDKFGLSHDRVRQILYKKLREKTFEIASNSINYEEFIKKNKELEIELKFPITNVEDHQEHFQKLYSLAHSKEIKELLKLEKTQVRQIYSLSIWKG